MKISEIAQRIQSLYSKGVQSDDTRLTFRHIYNKMMSGRSKIVTQKLNKKQKIGDWNYQTLECVPLTEVPMYDCPCIPPIGCKVWRTVEKLPKPMTSLYGQMIRSVTSINGKIEYSETTWESQKYKSGSKYTKFKPDYFIKNEYLYIMGKNTPKLLTIVGLFEDPVEINVYSTYCSEEAEDNCESPLDMEFPIDAEDVETLVNIATEELIVKFSQGKEDLRNDTKDNIYEDTK